MVRDELVGCVATSSVIILVLPEDGTVDLTIPFLTVGVCAFLPVTGHGNLKHLSTVFGDRADDRAEHGIANTV